MVIEKLHEELKDLNENEMKTVLKQVQALKRARQSPLAYIEEMMNFQFVSFDSEKQTYIYRMYISDELKNRFQILHGGILATFIDTAMGATIFQVAGPKTQAVTLDLQVHFLAPGTTGWLYAHTIVIKKGRTIITLESKVYDEQEKIIAVATSTFFQKSG